MGLSTKVIKFDVFKDWYNFDIRLIIERPALLVISTIGVFLHSTLSTSWREKLSEIEATRADLKAALAECNDTVLHLSPCVRVRLYSYFPFSLLIPPSLSSYISATFH